MKTENYKIRDLLKARHVTRWHIVSTAKSQSLAEHQWNVSVISGYLARLMGAREQDVFLVVGDALIHDIEEIETGDLPSPYKEKLRANGSLSPKSEEGVAIHIPTLMHEDEDGPPVRPGSIGIPISTIVRVADLLETWWWIGQYAIGQDSNAVILDCHDRMWDYVAEVPYELQKAFERVYSELR